MLANSVPMNKLAILGLNPALVADLNTNKIIYTNIPITW